MNRLTTKRLCCFRQSDRFGTCLWIVVVALVIGSAPAWAQGPPDKTVLGVNCAQVDALGISQQMNFRADSIMIGCGLAPGGAPGPGSSSSRELLIGGTNVDVVTGAEVWPHVTQSESMIATADGITIVVNYNDSANAPSNYSGISYSNDGGNTWTRILPSPLSTGHGTNFGDPIIVWNAALAQYFVGDLVSGGDCGSQGIGLWSSPDGVNWNVASCAHLGRSDDRESMWADNNSSSPFFGRMYISWNDFAVAARLFVTYSDDGVTWSTPQALSDGFLRDVQLTGSPEDGSVYLAAMDEGGGQFNTRQNWMFRSFDGGTTWFAAVMGERFPAPGDSLCSAGSYFVRINPIWRHMGWGQPAVGPGGVVHYVYAAATPTDTSTDHGDIYYQRSVDSGATWSDPIVLNTDASGLDQWMPSLSVTRSGVVQAAWYDRRNSVNGSVYEYWGRQSPDNGDSWLDDARVSDRIIVQPEQPDLNVQACYAGDYNYHVAFDDGVNPPVHYMTWTDGRNYVLDPNDNVHFQQDIFFASIP
jgi:hypothetical protein